MALVASLALWACATAPLPTRFNVAQHRLAPGDIVMVSVFAEPDLSGEFRVNDAGDIDYPLVGALPARCKTVVEFGDELAGQFTNYLRQPRVDVAVRAYAPYHVDGAVTAPGAYRFAPGVTVAQAIEASGGPVRGLQRARVRIEHVCASSEAGVALDSDAPVFPGHRLRLARR